MSSSRYGAERGAALLMVLVLAALVGALGAMLALQGAVDVALAGSYRTSEEARYAAEAGIERVAGDLAALPDWSVVLAAPPGNVTATYGQPGPLARAPDGRLLSDGVLLAERQAATRPTCGAATPAWRLYLRTPLAAMWPRPLAAPPAFVLVFVGDDCAEGDGDPSTDTNGRVWLHAEAFGLQGARRGIEAIVERAGPAAIRLRGMTEIRP